MYVFSGNAASSQLPRNLSSKAAFQRFSYKLALEQFVTWCFELRLLQLQFREHY